MATITINGTGDNRGTNLGTTTYTLQAAAISGQIFLLFNDTPTAVEIVFTPGATTSLTFPTENLPDPNNTNRVKIDGNSCLAFTVAKTGTTAETLVVSPGNARATHLTDAVFNENVYYVRSGVASG